MAKHNLSSQDVRSKILQLRDSLVLNLEFLQECIDRDYVFLREYFKRFGDLNYRPIIGRDIDGVPNYGERTEVMLEPVASKYRATIKSLLDSIRLIEAEILPEDNPEGASSVPSNENPEDVNKRRHSLREQFTVGKASAGKAPESIEEDEEERSDENAIQQLPSNIESPKTPISQEKPKPWRTKPVAFQPKQDVAKEPEAEKPKEKEEPKKAVGLSPLMRAKIMGTQSRLSELQKKYSGDDDAE